MSPDDEILRGEQMGAWLKSPPVIDLFAKLRDQYITQWEGSADVAQREAAFAKMKVLMDVQTDMRAAVGQGEIAKANVSRRKKMMGQPS